MGPSLPPSGLSVQAQEKINRKETNRLASKKRTERKKKLREAEVAMTATAKDGAYESYVSLVGDLKKVPMDFEKQTEILCESEVVRWREHRTLSFDRKKSNTIVYNPPRHERSFVMQIRATISSTNTITVWEDLLEVKASRLITKSAGLGLFARRNFKKGDIISLYAGVSFDPSK